MAVRMAHIQLPEDLGIEDAILPGDPARVDRVAALLEQPEELMFNREYKSVRGLWKGRPVLIISTGMGGPSTAIAVEELARTGVRQMIRIGSCGALTPTLDLGDLVLVCGAVRDDGTTAVASSGYSASSTSSTVLQCGQTSRRSFASSSLSCRVRGGCGQTSSSRTSALQERHSFTISFVLGPAFCTWKSGPPCFSAIVNALVITEYCASKTILRTAQPSFPAKNTICQFHHTRIGLFFPPPFG